MESTKISIDELKNVANSMETKKDQINNLYETKIKKSILYVSKTMNNNNQIQDEIEIELKKAFIDFDTNMDDLIQLLKNTIIPNYEDLSNELKYLFNKQFAKEMEKILEIKGE